MGLVNFNVPIGPARKETGTIPSMPVVSVNGVRPDAYGRVRIPNVTSGDTDPTSTASSIAGDQYLNKSTKELWHVVSVDGTLVWKKQAVLPLTGKSIRLDDDNDLYNAVQLLLEGQGATVR